MMDILPIFTAYAQQVQTEMERRDQEWREKFEAERERHARELHEMLHQFQQQYHLQESHGASTAMQMDQYMQHEKALVETLQSFAQETLQSFAQQLQDMLAFSAKNAKLAEKNAKD